MKALVITKAVYDYIMPLVEYPKDGDTFYDVTNKVSQYESGKNLIVIWLDYNELSDSYKNEGQSCGTSGSNCLSAATVSQGFASVAHQLPRSILDAYFCQI